MFKTDTYITCKNTVRKKNQKNHLMTACFVNTQTVLLNSKIRAIQIQHEKNNNLHQKDKCSDACKACIYWSKNKEVKKTREETKHNCTQPTCKKHTQQKQ